MSDISEIFSLPTTSIAAPGSSVTAKDDDLMGKQDFLTLLVAQLKNQDPLNPDDPTEFTSQLAQFSSLEQLQNLNGSMEDLTSAQMQSERLAAMTLIGKDVVYPSSDFTLADGSATLGYQVDGSASSVSMYIQDSAGAVVTTLHPTELSQGNHFVTWDGLDSDGNQVADGNYKVIMQANSGSDDTTVAISPLVRSEVTGLIMDSGTGEARLQTTSGEVSINSIIATYNTEANTTGIETVAKAISDKEKTSSTVEAVEEAAEITRIVTSSDKKESAPRDEDQIAVDLLKHHLSG